MAVRPSSKRTTRPRATSFKAHLSFNCAGQLMESSTRRPGTSICAEVKSTPALDMLSVFPSPASSLPRLLMTRYRRSRSIGNRSECRRSALSFSFVCISRLTTMIVRRGEPAHNRFREPFWAVRGYLFVNSTTDDSSWFILTGSFQLGPAAPRANLLQALLDALLQTAAGGLIKYCAPKTFRQAVHVVHGVLELVRVLVALPVTPL